MNDENEKRTLLAQKHSVIVGLFFAGAFLTALTTDGHAIPFHMLLLTIVGAGLLSVAFGMAAKAAYNSFSNAAREPFGKVTFAFILVGILFVSLCVSIWLSGANKDRCTACSAPISDSLRSSSYEDLCADCLVEDLISGDLAFCESCYDFYEREDIKAGLCTDCFNSYDWNN